MALTPPHTVPPLRRRAPARMLSGRPKDRRHPVSGPRATEVTDRRCCHHVARDRPRVERAPCLQAQVTVAVTQDDVLDRLGQDGVQRSQSGGQGHLPLSVFSARKSRAGSCSPTASGRVDCHSSSSAASSRTCSWERRGSLTVGKSHWAKVLLGSWNRCHCPNSAPEPVSTANATAVPAWSPLSISRPLAGLVGSGVNKQYRRRSSLASRPRPTMAVRGIKETM